MVVDLRGASFEAWAKFLFDREIEADPAWPKWPRDYETSWFEGEDESEKIHLELDSMEAPLVIALMFRSSQQLLGLYPVDKVRQGYAALGNPFLSELTQDWLRVDKGGTVAIEPAVDVYRAVAEFCRETRGSELAGDAWPWLELIWTSITKDLQAVAAPVVEACFDTLEAMLELGPDAEQAALDILNHLREFPRARAVKRTELTDVVEARKLRARGLPSARYRFAPL